MLSRLVGRGSVAAARAAFRPRSVPPVRAAFCSTVPATKKDDDDKLKPEGLSLDGPLVRYGLTDWKFSAPIGAVMAIPFIANEWLILNEETQLVCMFAAFGCAIYKFAGDAIAKTFDDQAAAVIAEINRLEEVEIKMIKAQIEDAELGTTIVEDAQAFFAKKLEMKKKQDQVLLLEAKHKHRDQYVRWLDSAVATEKAQKKASIDTFINKTALQVAKNFSTDASLKKAAVDQVIEILKNPKAQPADLVGAEFEKVGQKLWAEVEAAQSGPQGSTASLISEFKAIKAKGDKLTEADEDALIRLYYQGFKAGVKLE